MTYSPDKFKIRSGKMSKVFFTGGIGSKVSILRVRKKSQPQPDNPSI